MSRATDLGPAKVNLVLTNLMKGYAMPGYSADKLSPIVPVDGLSGKIRKYGKEYFKYYDTTRAPRAGSARINIHGSTLDTYQLKERSFEVPIDETELLQADDEMALKKSAALTATNAIQMDSEIELATKLQATATYSSGMYTTLTSGSELDVVTVDPIKFLLARQDEVRGKIARKPGVLWLAPDVATAIMSHPLVTARLGNADLKVVTMEQLAKLLPTFEEIIVPESVYSDGTDFFDIYTDTCGMFYRAPEAERSANNPSFNWTLRLKGKESVTITEYPEPQTKSNIVCASIYEQHYTSTQDAAFLIKNCLA